VIKTATDIKPGNVTSNIKKYIMLKTRNIYIDTEVFVASNYFNNENLKRIQKFTETNTISVFMTEITKSEIQKNIKEDINNAINEINKFRQNIANKGKVLKNIDKFKPYFDLPKIELNLDYSELSEKLDQFIESANVEIIPYELADIKEVVQQYLNEKPPFKAGRKKYEFPDAIVISALRLWCEKNSTKIYFVSSDSDFRELDIPNIVVIPSVKTLLSKINNQYSHDESQWILEIFKNKHEEIIKKISQQFEAIILDEMMYDIEISNIHIKKIELDYPSLVESNKESGEHYFQLDFDITFTADIEQPDYSVASYDKEDDRFYNVGRTNANYELHFTQTAEIAIEAYYEDKDETEIIISCTYVSIPAEYQIEAIIENDFY
jgi:predicted nucleic acid-binding protein